jgi:hypothetical protein
MLFKCKKIFYHAIFLLILLSQIKIIGSQVGKTCIFYDTKLGIGYNLEGKQMVETIENTILIQPTMSIQTIISHIEKDPLSKDKSLDDIILFTKKIITTITLSDKSARQEITSYFLELFLSAIKVLKKYDNQRNSSFNPTVVLQFKSYFLTDVQTVQKATKGTIFSSFAKALAILILSSTGYFFNKKYTLMCQAILSLWPIVTFREYCAISIPLNNVGFIDAIKL